MGADQRQLLTGALVFVRTPANKERIRPALSPNNVEKTMTTPVIAIVVYDSRFYEHLPRLFQRNPRKRLSDLRTMPSWQPRSRFAMVPLQGGYFLLAARAVGLDCGPMSGVDNAKVDAEFFLDGRFKSNFLCGLGCGDPAKVHHRFPRFASEEVCTLV